MFMCSQHTAGAGCGLRERPRREGDRDGDRAIQNRGKLNWARIYIDGN